MDSHFNQTLRYLLAHAPKGRDDWWLIGSAALRIMGVDVEARDVDLLTTRDGGLAWLSVFGLPPDIKPGRDMFRSTVFKSLKVDDGLELEIMGHLEVATHEGWRLLLPRTRQAVTTPVGTVYVPEAHEMLKILMLFGRPKDMDRAALLRDFMRSR